MKVIGLMGKSKSGKDTAGQMLIEHDPHGATVAFADKLKEVCMDLYGLTREDFYTEEGKARVLDGVSHPLRLPCWKCMACGSLNCTKEAPSQIVCHKCTMVGEPAAFASFWTPRMILQHVGTEGIRFVDPNTWVRHALVRAERMLAGNAVGRTNLSKPVAFVAITDCRFRSEAQAIWAAGGQVWRIRRPATDRSGQGIAGHVSETEMDTIPDAEFQWVINNDASLEVFRGKVIEGLRRLQSQS